MCRYSFCMRTLYAALFFIGFIAAALSLAAHPVMPYRSCRPLVYGQAGGYPGNPDYASFTLLRSEAARLVVLRATKASPRAWVRR